MQMLLSSGSHKEATPTAASEFHRKPPNMRSIISTAASMHVLRAAYHICSAVSPSPRFARNAHGSSDSCAAYPYTTHFLSSFSAWVNSVPPTSSRRSLPRTMRHLSAAPRASCAVQASRRSSAQITKRSIAVLTAKSSAKSDFGTYAPLSQKRRRTLRSRICYFGSIPQSLHLEIPEFPHPTLSPSPFILNLSPFLLKFAVIP